MRNGSILFRVATPLEQAEEALRLADWAAGRAAPVAAAAERRARHARDARAVSIAERAWGRALLQCGDVASAIEHLRTSIEWAERAGSPELAGESRIPLGAALVQHGKPRQAIREIDLAVQLLTGAGKARARGQRASTLHHLGRTEQAVVEYHAAIPLLRRSGDLLNLQRTLVNRGILHTERHMFTAAEKDLHEADRLARRLGRHLAAGIIAENLGYLETLRGDVPAAMAYLNRAEATIAEQGGQLGPVFLDRSELLLSVGAAGEAQQDALRAVQAFQRERRGLLTPIARLQLSHAASLTGDWPTALDQGHRARREFIRQGRSAWAAQAELAALRSELGMRSRPRTPTARLRRMVDALSGVGWPAAALEARIAVAQVLRWRGMTAEAAEMLQQAATARRRGPAGLRARGWYAEALVRSDAGRPAASQAAIRSGLRLLDEHSTSLGAADLRAYSAVHRTELSELGLREALRNARPGRVFHWAERGRASRLQQRSVLPPADPVLAVLLADLRATARAADRSRDVRLAQRQVELERRIRDHSRLHGTAVDGQAPVPVSVARLAGLLGPRRLVEFVQLDSRLHALDLVDGRLRLREVAPVALVGDLVDRLTFGLRRLGAGATGVDGLLAAAASRLDDLLIEPIVGHDDLPLVVVPTGALHNLPWSLLPSCRGRPVTVSPSATVWASASGARTLPCPTVAVVAGPDLVGAHAEAVAVAALHGVPAIVGDAATVDAALRALASADIVHFAAHGRLAADNPLFSSLRLHDGPLVVHDLERQHRVPHTVVLASCESGRSVVCTGDELIGLCASFISGGAAQLVAPVVPIPDAQTAPLMAAFHRRLADGDTAAVALAHAQQQVSDQGPHQRAAAGGFICLGRNA